jgi:CheY-like chemotaxis protein
MNPRTIAAPGSGAPSQWLPRILVVEDDVLVRVAAAQYLRGCGFAVLEAVNVDEALDILGADKLVRVVFTDVKLPGERNGLDLTRTILSDHPNVRVLLTSGVSPFPDALNGVTLLKKPYFLYDVERHVRSLLAQLENRTGW